VTDATPWRIYIYTGELIVRFGPALLLALLNFFIIWRFRQITQKRREMRRGGADMETNDQLLLRGDKITKKIYKEEKRLVSLYYKHLVKVSQDKKDCVEK
jgi:hypothetical protein